MSERASTIAARPSRNAANCSGDMYGSVPPIRATLRRGCRIVGQVEIQQHRLAIVGQQHVGRLQVAVDDAAIVGVRQAVGQLAPDPQDRLNVGLALEAVEQSPREFLGERSDIRTAQEARPRHVAGGNDFAGRMTRDMGRIRQGAGVEPGDGGELAVVERADDVPSGSRQRCRVPQPADNIGQGGAAAVRHANRRRRPVAWIEWIGTMLVCWSRASVCDSSALHPPARASAEVTFKATRRSANSICRARKTRPKAPRPSSDSSRKPRNVPPTDGRRAFSSASAGDRRDSPASKMSRAPAAAPGVIAVSRTASPEPAGRRLIAASAAKRRSTNRRRRSIISGVFARVRFLAVFAPLTEFFECHGRDRRRVTERRRYSAPIIVDVA